MFAKNSSCVACSHSINHIPIVQRHPGVVDAKVGYFGVKSTKVYRVQMGTKPAKGRSLGPRCAKVVLKCGAAPTRTDARPQVSRPPPAPPTGAPLTHRLTDCTLRSNEPTASRAAAKQQKGNESRLARRRTRLFTPGTIYTPSLLREILVGNMKQRLCPQAPHQS